MVEKYKTLVFHCSDRKSYRQDANFKIWTFVIVDFQTFKGFLSPKREDERKGGVVGFRRIQERVVAKGDNQVLVFYLQLEILHWIGVLPNSYSKFILHT